ncbi:cell envelope biogenesis protein TolA [Bradyrhizobium manausense]|uniref:cell envelope biogenesis protein TolA n=1 Tax=Bradyrhizobium manausense TaxID=989370 RepID=UPI001BACF92D|nr:cell envelope biogenesis protein TolA [Bradyrhizobium manausense]MBR0831348.1 cell envelope biogenesis protein TolA [Bradyrhizobium manausense]
MARKLKTYQTSLGFFDLAIAAPSMKAALQAWGADSNLFHQGFAKESDDPEIIKATLAAPGVVLRRPVGSSGRYKENAELPTDLGDDGHATKAQRKARSHKPSKHSKRPRDPKAEQRAALAYEKEERLRAKERAKEAAAQQRERERRQQAISKAQNALDAARQEYETKADDIRQQIDVLERKLQAQQAAWEKEKMKLEAALQKARK